MRRRCLWVGEKRLVEASDFARHRARRSHAPPPIGHEEAPARVPSLCGFEVPQPLQLGAQVVRQPVDAVVVDLDEVARRVADVELGNVAGQLEVVAEGLAVEGAAAR